MTNDNDRGPPILRDKHYADPSEFTPDSLLREARRQLMPLNPLIGADYRAMAQRTDDQLKALWQRQPWRE